MVNRPNGYKRFKTQSSKEGSHGTLLMSRDNFFASQEIHKTMKDLRDGTRVQPQRGTSIKGQSKRVHQSHFEPEAEDKKSYPLETTATTSRTSNNDKELIRQLTTKNKEQKK